MNSKNLLTFQAVVAIFYSLVLLFPTRHFLTPYLVDPESLTDIAIHMSRLYGALLIAFGIGCWIKRNHEDHQLFVMLIAIANGINLIINFTGTQGDYLTSTNWSSVVVVAILTLWAVYCLVKK